MNYYNEFDPKAAAWLRELIKAGLIPAGEVDERSITEIKPNELTAFTQCHFFAGIGGWPLALKLAGWPEDKPVWTGSCPCQPFSVAGKGKGTSDERHLWPVFARLIGECGPEFVFGEQVANAIGAGWLDGVCADLEAQGYAVGAAVLGAHSVGAPHIRARLYWLAHAGHQSAGRRSGPGETQSGRPLSDASGCGHVGGLADTMREGSLSAPFTGIHCGKESAGPRDEQSIGCGDAIRVADANSNGCDQAGPSISAAGLHGTIGNDGLSGLGDADRSTQERFGLVSVPVESKQETGRSSNANAWEDYEVIGCADGKARRIESGIRPLANGVPGRVGLLRGYGNAIVPQVAAAFIQAASEAINDLKS